MDKHLAGGAYFDFRQRILRHREDSLSVFIIDLHHENPVSEIKILYWAVCLSFNGAAIRDPAVLSDQTLTLEKELIKYERGTEQ